MDPCLRRDDRGRGRDDRGRGRDDRGETFFNNPTIGIVFEIMAEPSLYEEAIQIPLNLIESR